MANLTPEALTAACNHYAALTGEVCRPHMAAAIHEALKVMHPVSHRAIPAGWLLFPAAAWEFLSGVAELDGVSFGDRHPTRGGAFWWRSMISAMIDAGPNQGGSNG